MTPVRNTVQVNVIGCGVRQVRDRNVPDVAGQRELQCIRLLLRVTDPDYKRIEMPRRSAPGQAEVMRAHG